MNATNSTAGFTIQTAKYALGPMFGIPIIYCIICLILSIRRDKTWYTTSKLFYVTTCCHATARLTLFFIPSTFYYELFKTSQGKAVQNILDLIPELLFLITYALILLSWMEVVHKSTRLRHFSKPRYRLGLADENGFVLFRFLRAMRDKYTVLSGLIIVLLILFVCIGGFSITIYFTNMTYANIVMVQGITIACLTALFTIAFVGYFIQISSLFVRVMKNTHSYIKRKLQRIVIIAITYFVFLTFRVVYVLVLNAWIGHNYRNGNMSESIFSLLWFFYFLVSEVLPIFILLTFLTLFDFVEAHKEKEAQNEVDRLEEQANAILQKQRSESYMNIIEDDELENTGMRETVGKSRSQEKIFTTPDPYL